MATIVLSLFAISLTLVQMSCSKSTAQAGSNTLAQINKIVYAKIGGSPTGFWVANYDGTGQTQVNVTLPSGYTISGSHAPALSPDGTKLFFVAYNSIGRSIFSCNINGTSLTQIVDCSNTVEVQLGGAY